ncbi:MAG: hypothetical protein PVF87_12150 [Acidimicrobiia bacterium]
MPPTLAWVESRSVLASDEEGLGFASRGGEKRARKNLLALVQIDMP